MAEALDVHNTTLYSAIKAQGGMVFKTVVDAFQASFATAPQAYQLHLLANHCQVSMSRVGNCYDNAVMESFFGTLKTECVTRQFATRAEARLAIFEYIEVWYNRQRLHSSLDYFSPVEFELFHGHFSCPLN